MTRKMLENISQRHMKAVRLTHLQLVLDHQKLRRKLHKEILQMQLEKKLLKL